MGMKKMKPGAQQIQGSPQISTPPNGRTTAINPHLPVPPFPRIDRGPWPADRLSSVAFAGEDGFFYPPLFKGFLTTFNHI
jgi:hypothetical protein